MGQRHPVAGNRGPILPQQPLDNVLLLSLFESLLGIALNNEQRCIYEALCRYYHEREDQPHVSESLEGMAMIGTLMDRVRELQINPEAPDHLNIPNPIVRQLFNKLTPVRVH